MRCPPGRSLAPRRRGGTKPNVVAPLLAPCWRETRLRRDFAARRRAAEPHSRITSLAGPFVDQPFARPHSQWFSVPTRSIARDYSHDVRPSPARDPAVAIRKRADGTGCDSSSTGYSTFLSDCPVVRQSGHGRTVPRASFAPRTAEADETGVNNALPRTYKRRFYAGRARWLGTRNAPLPSCRRVRPPLLRRGPR
jgi:hypothetical protein